MDRQVRLYKRKRANKKLALLFCKKEGEIMGNKEFVEKCKEIVKQYAIEHLDKSDNIPDFEIFVVWSCKTLQNNKALLSTTLHDGMYYELTYNGDKKELYFDAYKKFENKCIKIENQLLTNTR